MKQKSHSCKWTSLIGICLLKAVAIELMVVLAGAAVGAAVSGSYYHMLQSASILFSWPIFCLSLAASIVLVVKKGLTCCFTAGHGHCQKDTCAPEVVEAPKPEAKKTAARKAAPKKTTAKKPAAKKTTAKK